MEEDDNRGRANTPTAQHDTSGSQKAKQRKRTREGTIEFCSNSKWLRLKVLQRLQYPMKTQTVVKNLDSTPPPRIAKAFDKPTLPSSVRPVSAGQHSQEDYLLQLERLVVELNMELASARGEQEAMIHSNKWQIELLR